MKVRIVLMGILIIPALPIFPSWAQANQAGFSLGYSTHSTFWFRRAQQGDPQQFPINKTTMITLGGFYEKAGLFELGPIRSDLRFELFVGFGGKTEEDWLPLGETISDGDIGYGLAAILKFGYPVELSSGTELFPFLGLGPGVVGVSASGDASVDTQFATGLFYEEGFADGAAGLIVDVGVSVPLERITITPEVRFLVAGDSFGDWDYITSSDGADWTMFMINVGFNL